jgi:NADH:ubiquinone oxidoreductase subunit 5 (subunit L)/multisubunit Na+/H+ antiporter MnhA subunit
MAVAAFVKVFAAVFAGTPRTPAASHGRDPGPAMLAPMLVLAACCLLIGLWPSAALGLLNDAVGQWSARGRPTAPLQGYVALRWVSFLGLSLIALCAAVGAWLMRRKGRAQTRSGLTWDCGYARPTARIQYSGSSFSQMLVDLLGWVLWPRTRAPRLRGAFPSAEAFASEVPDVVLDRTLLPALGAADGILARARVIQRGTVQVYLLYVLGILIVLLLLG